MRNNKDIEMTADLVIIGAGGHGKVVADAANHQGCFKSISFLDDRFTTLTNQIGFPVKGNDDLIPELIAAGCQFVVAIGDNRCREDKYTMLSAAGAHFATIIHPLAVIAPSANIAKGTVVMAGAIINASAHIAENVIINTGAIVEHDCNVGSHTHIAPKSALTGGCSVGFGCLIGVGANIIPGRTIGNNVIVGAGSTVISDIPDDKVAVGIPARW